jgi:hypothetical protein
MVRSHKEWQQQQEWLKAVTHMFVLECITEITKEQMSEKIAQSVGHNEQ